MEQLSGTQNYTRQVSNTHYIVEDTFTNERWRFELGEEQWMAEYVVDLYKPTIHLVGATVDVTTAFTNPPKKL